MQDGNQTWTIIATQGSEAYLIEMEKNRGRVLDLNQGILFPEFNIHSIIARGGWEEFTGSQDILPDLIAKVKRYEVFSELPSF